jgi:hypothetical protein
VRISAQRVVSAKEDVTRPACSVGGNTWFIHGNRPAP